MPTDQSFATPFGYTAVRILGQGHNGIVYNSVSNTTLISARILRQNSYSNEPLRDWVLSRVVACKVPLGASLEKEVEILKAVRAQAGSRPGARHCAQLLDYEENTAHISWFVMATTPLCYHLEDFVTELAGPLPRPFLWLVATQLYRALWFLHRVCRPAIVHRDIGPQNILISYQGANSTGQPKITLIDFGSAVFLDEIEDHDFKAQQEQKDVKLLCGELNFLCFESCDGVGLAPSGEGAGKIQQFMVGSTDIRNLEALWNGLVEYAAERLVSARQEDWGEVETMTLQAVEKTDQRRATCAA